MTMLDRSRLERLFGADASTYITPDTVSRAALSGIAFGVIMVANWYHAGGMIVLAAIQVPGCLIDTASGALRHPSDNLTDRAESGNIFAIRRPIIPVDRAEIHQRNLCR